MIRMLLPANCRPRWKSKLIEPRSAHCKLSNTKSNGPRCARASSTLVYLLLEQIALLGTGSDGNGGRPAFNELIQTGQPVRPAGHTSPSPLKQSYTGDKGINQVRPGLHQRLRRNRQRIPQTAGLFSGHGPRRPPRFDIAGQQLQNLAEGQVGVADAGVGIAVAAGDDQSLP